MRWALPMDLCVWQQQQREHLHAPFTRINDSIPQCRITLFQDIAALCHKIVTQQRQSFNCLKARTGHKGAQIEID